MGTNENLQKDILNGFKHDSSLNETESSYSKKIGSHLKKIVFVTSLAGAALLFNACSAGYVANEPSYMEYQRPGRPNEYSIWIDGDWSWNSRSQSYYQTNGYWGNPRKGQSYMSGYWQSTPKGKTWTKGHWHADGRQKDNHNNNQDRHQDSY